jgi:hypothetical protein
MLYTQFRENERTARFEVRLVPGNRCQLSEAGREENGAAKPRAKKVAAESWSLGVRDDATWVDLEAELRRIRHRAPIDFGLRTGEEAGAGRELILRLDKLLLDLYRNESEDYLTYLGLLNIFEYFRLVHNLKHFDRETTGAKQLGLVSDDFFACRRIALERDLAELTEWLVAHGVGIPDLSIFYPEEYPSESAGEEAPKKKGRKKAGAEAEADGAEPQGMPVVVKHLAELVRLQQANTADLVHFVDDVMQRMQLSTPREALEKMQELLPWIDLDYLERQYNSLKVEQARETERQQMAIMRQREIFEKRPRRGTKGGHHVPTLRERPNREPGQASSEAFGGEGDEEGQPVEIAEHPIANGADATDGSANLEPQTLGDDHDELEDEDGQSEIFGHESGGGGGFHDDRHRDHPGGPRRRKRRGPRRGGDVRPPGRPAGGPPPQARQQGPPPPRRERPHRVGGQPNFDEIQPFSNYSPGLTPPPNSSAAVLAGGAAGKKKWRRRK